MIKMKSRGDRIRDFLTGLARLVKDTSIRPVSCSCCFGINLVDLTDEEKGALVAVCYEFNSQDGSREVEYNEACVVTPKAKSHLREDGIVVGEIAE